jgi:hypothetical protein
MRSIWHIPGGNGERFALPVPGQRRDIPFAVLTDELNGIDTPAYGFFHFGRKADLVGAEALGDFSEYFRFRKYFPLFPIADALLAIIFFGHTNGHGLVGIWT